MINIRKTRVIEIHDSYLDEFGFLDQESLLLKIQDKLEKEYVVVVPEFMTDPDSNHHCHRVYVV